MPVISVLNRKGGVGKTSTCFHLAGTLARTGRRVLLVDNTDQTSLSDDFLGSAEVDQLDPDSTVVAIYRRLYPRPAHVLRTSGVSGVDLIAGSSQVDEFNKPCSCDTDPGLRHALREFLAAVRDCYDMVLIDCPPGLSLCSRAALAASDGVIIPVEPDVLGTQGMASVRAFVDRVTARINPGLRLLGYLLNRVKPGARTHRLIEQRVRGVYGEDVFATTVPDAADFGAAVRRRKPVAQFRPRSAAAEAMESLAEEVDRRSAGRTRGGMRGAAWSPGGSAAVS